MGEVKTKIRLINFGDIEKAKDFFIPKNAIRSVEIDMVVDTGATMCVIGEDIAELLGIEKKKEITIELADGSLQKHYKGYGLLVEFGDRDCVTDCIILEKGIMPLLGQIPLEEMDLVVDCKRQKLIPNPESYEGRVIVQARKFDKINLNY